MLRLFLFITSLCLTLNCLCQSVNITVDLQYFPDKKFYLASYYGDKYQIVDTLKLVDGKYSILREKQFPHGIYAISGENNNKYFDLLMSNNQHFQIRTNYFSIIDSLKFTACNENQKFANYLRFSSKMQKENDLLKKLITTSSGKAKLDYIKQQNQILKDIKDFRHQYIIANPNTLLAALFKMMRDINIPKQLKQLSQKRYYYYISHYWDHIDFTDERLLRTPLLSSKVNSFFDHVLVQHPDTLIFHIDKLLSSGIHPEILTPLFLKLILKYEYPKIMGLDKIFVHLAEKYINSDLTEMSGSVKNALLERANKIKPLLIGKKAPDMITIDTLNQFQTIYSIKNKFTLLIFWDHDCQLCQKEIKFLKNIYEMNTFDLEVFAIETTTSIDKWKSYIRKHKLNWINVNGTQSQSIDFHELYDIYSTPTIYILNKDKRIIAKRISTKNILHFLQNYEQRN